MKRQELQETPTVLLSNHKKRASSMAKMDFSHVLSTMNPYTVIPALLFLKYVTAQNKTNISLVTQ